MHADLAEGSHLIRIMPLAMPCPTKPQTMPARLYSRNLTPRHDARAGRLYLGLPGRFGENTALGTAPRARCRPAARVQRHVGALQMGHWFAVTT